MGINFGDSNLFKQLSMNIGSFLRSQKTTGADSATGAKSIKALQSKTTDEFGDLSKVTEPAAQNGMDDVDFQAETQEACDWASQQPLDEALDHFENPGVGNGLMMMSLIEKTSS